MPSFAFFITHLVLLIRRRRFAEINLWILLIGVVSVSYLARYGKIDSINYSALVVPAGISSPEKKVLILDDDIATYRTNQLASGFFDWNLSRSIFENPDVYENVLLVYNSLNNDPPDVIIDPNNVMEMFFRRIPALEKKYVRTSGNTYARRI